jgi:membrane protease YdiL (CAAX protease family)
MPDIPVEPWLANFIGGLFLASIATWFWLVGRWRRHGEPLEYEPRTAVPWGLPAALLAVAVVLFELLSTSPEPQEEVNPSQMIVGLIFFQFLVIVSVVFVVTTFYRATWRDFGLPACAGQLARDVGIGCVACLAALAPAHGVQFLLLYLSGQHEEPPGHPLVKMVTSGEPKLELLLLASFAAVVVAPIGEEILFRLLLQGWLEKWETQRLAARDRAEVPPMGNDEARVDGESNAENEPSLQSGAADISAAPSGRSVAGLPFGWAPILVSSLLFALAHAGYGPDPVAIFMLAVILGYVYQRTHRIIPCMVTHALFNSLAMVILWQMVLNKG